MKAIVLAALLTLPVAAAAKTAPPAPAAAATVSVGTTVVGKDNKNVGTISAVTATAITIDTGTHQVPVPVAAVGVNPKGLWIGMTQSELDAAYLASTQQAQASFAAQLAPGKMVHGLNGAMLGTIKNVEGEFVDLTTPRGDVRLPKSGFGAGADGVAQLGLSQEQLYAAMAGTATAATTTPQS